MLSLLMLCISAVPGPDPNYLRRDHGPGTSGGGVMTQSGEVMKPGAVSLEFRIDYTQFEKFTQDEIRSATFAVGDSDHAHFDVLRSATLETFSFAFGATENLQFGLSFGYYLGNELREGHLHGDGSYGFHDYGDIRGMTDHWVTGKYRFYKGEEGGSWAALFGVKLPFGDDDKVGRTGTSNTPLEASLQPGSGSIDFMVGAAYSTYLTSEISMDASLQYTLRTEANTFKIGDLILFGVSGSYRFTESVQVFPQPSLFLEFNVRHLFRNHEQGEEVINSGGTVLFLSPGFRVGFSERVAFTIALQIPVVQALHDEQQEALFKLSTGFTFMF